MHPSMRASHLDLPIMQQVQPVGGVAVQAQLLACSRSGSPTLHASERGLGGREEKPEAPLLPMPNPCLHQRAAAAALVIFDFTTPGVVGHLA